MTQAYKELAMEDEIVARLQNQGWVYEEGSAARYDKQRALFPEDVFAWLEATQPDELAKIVKPEVGPAAQTKAKDGILNALAETRKTATPPFSWTKHAASALKISAPSTTARPPSA